MQWVSFDPFRSLGFAHTLHIKPEYFFKHIAEINAARWVLFPEYWQVNALVYGLKARIFPSHASYLLGHSKIEMTRAFMCVANANLPRTHIEPNTPGMADILWETMDAPFVAKLPRASQGEGVWLIENRHDWRQYLLRTDVLYVQEYLPIDRDIRVVVIGDQCLCAYWRLQSADGFHNNVARGGTVDFSLVPPAAIELALRVARELGIDHAGFDIAMVDGHPYLLEFNRLFGNQGLPGGDAQLRDAIFQHLIKTSTPPGPNFPDHQPPQLPEAA